MNSLGSEISCSCTVLERLNMVWFGMVSQTHHFNQLISVMSNSHANDIVEWCVYYCKWKVHPFCFGFGNCNRMRCACYILLLCTRAQVCLKFLAFFPSIFFWGGQSGRYFCVPYIIATLPIHRAHFCANTNHDQSYNIRLYRSDDCFVYFSQCWLYSAFVLLRLPFCTSRIFSFFLKKKSIFFFPLLNEHVAWIQREFLFSVPFRFVPFFCLFMLLLF